MLATTGIGLRGEGTFFHRLPTVNMISPTVQACKNSTCHWPCGVHRRAAEAERDRGRARRERRGALGRLACRDVAMTTTVRYVCRMRTPPRVNQNDV